MKQHYCKIVSPYRPFGGSYFHLHKDADNLDLGDFDWIDALKMMATSSHSIHSSWPVFAITDIDTDLPVPSLRFVTYERQLMLWILEVCLSYIKSHHFDTDTVMVSPDCLVVGDLGKYFIADITLLMRFGEKHVDRPFLNAVQWWSLAAKERLIEFYSEALEIAHTLPEDQKRWGADCESIHRMVAPIEYGTHERHGVHVAMINAAHILRPFNETTWGLKVHYHPIIDFRFHRKRYMRTYFESTMGLEVVA